MTDWQAQSDRLADPISPAHRVHAGLLRLIDLRKAEPVLHGQEMEIVDLHNTHVLAFLRGRADGDRLLIVANMTERDQALADGILFDLIGGGPWTDLVSGEVLQGRRRTRVGPLPVDRAQSQPTSRHRDLIGQSMSGWSRAPNLLSSTCSVYEAPIQQGLQSLAVCVV